MLPDLDVIEWSSFQHAYGPADDVPDMLRGLLDPDRRADCLARFQAAVNHQGWHTPAALPCMPFLAAALDEPTAPLADLVVLLADLAQTGSHEHWLPDRLRPQVREQGLHDPVLARYDRFLELSRHEDDAVRGAACLALAVLQERASTSLPRLREMVLEEKAVGVRASALLALGVLGTPADAALVDTVLAKKVAKTVDIAARCARLWLAPEDLAEASVMALLAAATEKVVEKRLCWAEGNLSKVAGIVANTTLARHARDDLLRTCAGKGATGLWSALVERQFPMGREIDSPEDLTEAQRLTLSSIAGCMKVLSNPAKERLRDAGVPSMEDGLRVFLGEKQGRLLDRIVDLGSDRRMTLWRVLRQAVWGRIRIADHADAILEQFGPGMLLDAVFEIARDKYHWPDVYRPCGRAVFAREDCDHVPQSFAGVVDVLAELLRPAGSDLVGAVTSQALPMLEQKTPNSTNLLLWLLFLARVGPLDARWDPLVDQLVIAFPAYQAPPQTREILAALPPGRREALLLGHPLHQTVTTKTMKGTEVVFQWDSTTASQVWWHLPACPTRPVLERVVDAIRRWSDLPPLPTLPRGEAPVTPHDPFPMRRAREFLAACPSGLVKECVLPLLEDERVDRDLVRRLVGEERK
jgi:hypothetical protein